MPSRTRKRGILAAIEAAALRGEPITFQTREQILDNLESKIADVEARYPPSLPPRLKPGRPAKQDARHESRMKGVRLDEQFLACLEPSLRAHGLTFSQLVQDLLGAWLSGPGRLPPPSLKP